MQGVYFVLYPHIHRLFHSFAHIENPYSIHNLRLFSVLKSSLWNEGVSKIRPLYFVLYLSHKITVTTQKSP